MDFLLLEVRWGSVKALPRGPSKARDEGGDGPRNSWTGYARGSGLSEIWLSEIWLSEIDLSKIGLPEIGLPEPSPPGIGLLGGSLGDGAGFRGLYRSQNLPFFRSNSRVGAGKERSGRRDSPRRTGYPATDSRRRGTVDLVELHLPGWEGLSAGAAGAGGASRDRLPPPADGS